MSLSSITAVPQTYPQRKLRNWFSGGISGKKCILVGSSETATVATEMKSWIDAQANLTGGQLEGATMVYNAENGASLEAYLNNSVTHGITDTISQTPNLIVTSYGGNSVRVGSNTLASFTALLRTQIETITAALPSVEFVLWGLYPFLTTDIGSVGLVVPNSSAQAYTDILYDSYESLREAYPNVAVLQRQGASPIYPRTCPVTSAWYTNQLHVGTEAQSVAVRQMVDFISPYPIIN